MMGNKRARRWWLPLLACLLLALGQGALAAKLRVVVRYDDYSAISDTAVDHRFLHGVSDLGASTLVSIIPMVGTEYASRQTDTRPLPVNLSQEKLDLLKSLAARGAIEIALHGHSHRNITKQGKPSEFRGRGFQEQIHLLAGAKNSLEHALGRSVDIFVPPYNSYDRDTLLALPRAGIRILSAGWDGPVVPGDGLVYLPAGPHPDKVDEVIRQSIRQDFQHAILVISVHSYDFADSNEALPVFREHGAKVSMDALFSDLYKLRDNDIVEFTTVTKLIKSGEDLSWARMLANQRLKTSTVTTHRMIPAVFDLYPHLGLYYSQAKANELYWKQIAVAILFYAGVLLLAMVLTRQVMRFGIGRHPMLDDLMIASSVIIPLLVLLGLLNRFVFSNLYMNFLAIGMASIGILLQMFLQRRNDIYTRFFNNENGLMKYLSLPLRYKLWFSRHARLILADLTHPASQEQQPHQVHLAGAIDWLCHAQDVRHGKSDAGGVSAGWSFEDGWLPSYPETTGYIIETFLAAARILNRPELVDRAQRMIDWELSLQSHSGAFPGHFGEPGSRPVIFNQGQILHGMLAGYLQLGRQDCLEAAVSGGHWMAAQQDEDGCWRRFEHNDTPHVYNTRATWALLHTGLVANDAILVQAARRNLDWALGQQTESGWYATNAFVPWRSPFTHTIAYAIRGFLESGMLLGEQRYLDSALMAGRALARVQRQDGWLAGTYKDGWVADAGYACLTGIAQMSLNWTRMAQVTGDDSFGTHARAALAYLKTTQRLEDADDAVRGAIAGSSPIWGGYSRFEYPNWAAKFFADALMMDLADIAIPPVPEMKAHG